MMPPYIADMLPLPKEVDKRQAEHRLTAAATCYAHSGNVIIIIIVEGQCFKWYQVPPECGE